MIREVDLSLKKLKPELSVAKPTLNRTIIGHLPEASNINLNLAFGKIHELTFELPYEIEKKNVLINNPNIEKTKEKYLIRLKLGNTTEWFIIDEINEDMDESDTKSITAYSLAYELTFKLVRGYEVVSKNIQEIMTDLLVLSSWSIGTISPEFANRRREFSVSEQSLLDFIFEMAEKFGAIVQFDSINKKIHFKTEEETRRNRGLRVSEGDLLTNLNKKSEPSQMITRLNIYGKDGMGINSLVPTGASYVESFAYYLYPFQRDENKNVIKSSDYMDDDLCHAILDYEELLESKQGTFEDLLAERKTHQTALTSLQTDLAEIETRLIIQEDRLEIMKLNEEYANYPFVKNTVSTFHKKVVKPNETYVAVFKCDSIANLNVLVNLATVPVQPNTLQIIHRVQNTSENTALINVNLTGEAIGTNCKLEFIKIKDEEFAWTDQQILDEYSLTLIEDEKKTKNNEITVVQGQMNQTDSEIAQLKAEVSVENNFTPDQIVARDSFIHTQTWSNENIIDAEELLEEGLKKFEEFKVPKMTYSIGLVNFLEILEEHKRWDKLNLGEDISIFYEKFNVNVRAMILEINLDFENADIGLVIANYKDINSEKDRLVQMLYKSYSTSNSVDMSKYKWNDNVDKTSEISELLDGTWDASTRKISAGVNESVEISNRGITIRSSDNPDELIRIQSGIIGLSTDGGSSYRTAITGKSIIAEQVMGKLLAGQNLIIENESGKFRFDANGATIEGSSFNLIGGNNGVKISPQEGLVITKSDGLNRTLLNATEGMKIQKNIDSVWTNLFSVDENGDLNMTGKFNMSGGQLEGNSNFYWDSTGFYAVDPLRADHIVKISSQGIHLSINGGATWSTAITAEGIVAEQIKVGRLEGHDIIGAYIEGSEFSQISGLRQVDISEGRVLSYYDGKLSMDFGQYALDFFARDGTAIGKIAPTNIYDSPADQGLGIFSYKDYISMGFPINGFNRSVLYSSKVDALTRISGVYTSANSGSGLILQGNQYIADYYTGYRQSDQPTIQLDEGVGKNSAIVYFNGRRDRNSGFFEIRNNTTDAAYQSVLHANKDRLKIYSMLELTPTTARTFGKHQFMTSANVLDISVVPYSNAVRWQTDGSNYIRQFDTGTVEFVMGGTSRHAFFSDGTKSGGSVQVEGQNLGMSPIDSPQTLLEYIEFDLPLTELGVKVYIDETYLKTVYNFAVFPNNGTILEKGSNYFIISGKGLADCRIVGERIGHEGMFYWNMNGDEEVERESIEEVQ